MAPGFSHSLCGRVGALLQVTNTLSKLLPSTLINATDNLAIYFGVSVRVELFLKYVPRHKWELKWWIGLVQAVCTGINFTLWVSY